MMDVDGVLTDGHVMATASGEMLRRLSAKDGYALQFAVKLGYRIAILSGGYCPGVERRLQNLGLRDLFFSTALKLPKFQAYLAEHQLAAHEVLYIGDDMPDREVMAAAGLAVAPADACEDILEAADYVTRQPGGYGCVREVIEKTLKAQQQWYRSEGKAW
jgi:3-deoxy-D-manno-octulosonate 8-phosphate phosphatase (KDO 8-P phosphatase)